MEHPSRLRTGTQLPNGAILIEVSSRIILAKTESGDYVTWRWDGENLRTTGSGHYFTDLLQAVEDFYERAGIKA